MARAIFTTEITGYFLDTNNYPDGHVVAIEIPSDKIKKAPGEGA